MDVLASFYTLLYSIRMRREGEDKLWWVPSRIRKFDVRSFYKILASKEAISFPWKSIWRTKAPLRVAFFAWLAVLEKILTMYNLRKRHFTVVNRCCLCKLDGKTADFLPLHCKVASDLGTA